MKTMEKQLKNKRNLIKKQCKIIQKTFNKNNENQLKAIKRIKNALKPAI